MTIPLQQGFGFNPDIDSSIVYNEKRAGNVNVACCIAHTFKIVEICSLEIVTLWFKISVCLIATRLFRFLRMQQSLL